MALDRLRNLGPLANAVGLYMVGKAQGAFREQGRPSNAWPGRAPVNRIGILLDLQQGRKPPERRFESRPAAIDTGRLRQSIAYRVQDNSVVVGSNLPYASDVQRGSSKTIPVDRRALAAWLRGLSGARKDQMRRAFGPLFASGSLTVKVPPRPFLVVTDEDRRQINDLARKFFAGAFKT